MAERDIERALDALYAVPPEKFVEARDAQARALKDAGDKDGAAQLRAAHKPTQQAHALNRAVPTGTARLPASAAISARPDRSQTLTGDTKWLAGLKTACSTSARFTKLS